MSRIPGDSTICAAMPNPASFDQPARLTIQTLLRLMTRPEFRHCNVTSRHVTTSCVPFCESHRHLDEESCALRPRQYRRNRRLFLNRIGSTNDEQAGSRARPCMRHNKRHHETNAVGHCRVSGNEQMCATSDFAHAPCGCLPRHDASMSKTPDNRAICPASPAANCTHVYAILMLHITTWVLPR